MTYRLPRTILYAIAGAALMAPPAMAEIDDATISFVEDQVAKGLYPDFMIALVEGDDVTYRSFGVASKESGEAPTADTPFEIGSITKTFTGLLLAEMTDEGTVKLDDPVQKYLPDGVTMPQVGEDPMTLGNIAEQRSGLPRLPADFAPANPLDPYADYDDEKLWTSVNGLKLTARPGETYEYSNFGFGLLGTLLARAADTSYAALLRSKVFEPLEMNDTTLDVPPNLAQGYMMDTGTATPPWQFDALAGAGAVKSTARDMVKYLRANMGEAGPEALQVAAAEAQEPRVDSGMGNMRVGLAWMTMPKGNGHWHYGGTYGFRSFAGIDRENRRAVIIWTNAFAVNDPIDQVGMHILNPDMPLPAPRPAKMEHTEINMPVAELATYEGTYKMDFGPTLTMRLNGKQMMAQLSGQPEAPVYPEATDHFFYRIVDAQLEFTRGEDGAITGVTIHQSGMHLPGRKQ